jgi:hypothetical protein
MNRQLLTSAVPLLASGAVAAGVTQVVGSTIDTQGYQDITIIAHLGAITATGTATLKVAQGEQADGSDKADLAGSAVVATDAHSNKAIAIDIHRPTERYITPILNRATANVVVVAITVILHGAAHTPVQQSYVVAHKALNGPAEGAA